MIAASRRVLPRAPILIAGLFSAAFGEVLEFRAAVGSTTSPVAAGSAVFNSVAAIPEIDATNPARAFVGGLFTGQFGLGNLNPLLSNNGEDGVLAGFTRVPGGGAWIADWLLQARSDGGNARITDVALSPEGWILVTGIFSNDVTFDLPPPANPITLITLPAGPEEGFVAWADPVGNWINAFPVNDMRPNSIAADEQGTIYLTGRPDLARCYDQAGIELWRAPEPPETVSLRHIAVSRAGGPHVYVQGSSNKDPAGGGDEDVFIVQLDQVNGQERWTTTIASGGDEHPGGLGLGPRGDVRTAVSSNGDDLTVEGAPIQDKPPFPGRHGHLIFLTPDGTYVRDNLLGASGSPGGRMETHDLAIDYAGNNYVAVSFAGPFVFEGIPHPGQEDAAVVAIDTLGAQIRFTDTTGGARALGNAVAAPDRTLQVLVGGLLGGAIENFDAIPVPGEAEGNGFFGAIEPSDNQQSYILTSPTNEDLNTMAGRITQAGGEVYRALEILNDPANPQDDVRFVAADLTTEQLADLANFFEVALDRDLFRDGTVTPSGWALEALNSAPAGSPYSYTFPETCHETVLYLIDSSVDTSSGFFSGNSNLTIGSSHLVRSIGEPDYPTAFDHGTKMLSMVAGPTYGVAQGTPVTVVTIDIYPDGVSAKLSALVEAIALANSDRVTNFPEEPSVYCVASSALTPGKSTSSLESVVDYAIGPDVYSTVVFSAGNTTGNANDYTPSDLGSKSGVICAGGLDAGNLQLGATRGDPGVDLWAPGDAVPAADSLGLPTTVTGTSASTALVAGTALTYLSANPVAIPADLETALLANGQAAAIGTIAHVPLTGLPGFVSLSDWANWHGLTDTSASGNDDGDNWTNEEEFIWGFHPLVAEYQGSIISLTYNHSTSTLTFEFPVSCTLYQPSALTYPYTLRDGSKIIIERSGDLRVWTDLSSKIPLVEVGHSGGQVKLSFDYVVSESRCFFRVKVQ